MIIHSQTFFIIGNSGQLVTQFAQLTQAFHENQEAIHDTQATQAALQDARDEQDIRGEDS